ncbi:hypothetical protein M8J76_008725 [Diaphorina citri]|nr:hypothetical protein M8J76_008725 [Diaphorina citri]
MSSSGTPVDKAKQVQCDMLMEKLKNKASQYKSFFDMAKALRMTILEKRYAIDNVERSQLQKCLDLLQQSIKVNSLQAMVERLESISRQLGLKFMAGQSGFDWFISSDMFYLEVVLEASGNVKDVKIHHEGRDQQSCEELIQCLQNQDFNDFTVQLESLTSIYQLNAEKKVKSKAFAALQSLEADLITLASLQTNIKDPFLLIHKSPVGALHKRRGGHAMMLTYFVSPYDLLDLKNKISKPLSADSVDVGFSVTVSMESSCAHKLQITTLVTVSVNPSGKNTPVYGASTPQNTASLPACFVLKLNKPTPMCVSLVKKIQAVTEMECSTVDTATPKPLLSLIIQHQADKTRDSTSNKPLFVSLPDQNHCYFMTENPSLQGILVTSIPFTHPSHVSQILLYLRQQALFNSLLASCIRHTSKPADFEDLTMFEITPLSVQHLSISFEHPVEESLATAELDLTDIGQLQCNVFAANTADSSPTTVETSEFASKVLQRCFSIPITMRSLIKSWQSAASKNALNNLNLMNGGGSLSLGDISMGEGGGMGGGGGPGSNSEGGFHGNGNTGGGEYDPDRKMKMEPNDDVMELPVKPKSENLFDGNIVSIDFPSYSPLHSDSFPASDSPFGSYVSNNNVPGKSSDLSFDDEKKLKKRKVSDPLWPKKDELILESSSNESTPLGTPKEISDMRESLAGGSLGGMEFSSLGDLGSLTSGDKVGDFDMDEDVMEVNDLDDVEEFLKLSAKKIKKSKDITGLKLDDKLQPAVSISPLQSPSQSFNISGVNLDRRPGIEIIPIASADTLGRPLTETEQLRNERKIKSKSLEEKARLEKKRKRKRDDSPMGPPDKPAKLDSSSKPSSSSSSGSSSGGGSSKSDPNVARKYPSSPIPFSSSGKSSPGNNNNSKVLSKPLGSRDSPLYSSSSSPKNNVLSSSPKHHSSVSPKQTSSGKPSMSALKSAVTSPTSSSKSDSSKKSSSSKDFQSGREKDKKLSSSSSGNSSHSSPKLKPPTVKMKPDVLEDLDPSKGDPSQMRKKGSLSAVIDKLKSAQHGGEPGSGEGGKESSQVKSTSMSSKTSEGKVTSSGKSELSSKIPGEYQVKHSSDGMKITINKTKTLTKIAKPSSSSPKFTGLKPGVISGPASKKSSTLSSKPPTLSSSSGSSTSTGGSSSSKISSSSASSSSGVTGSSTSSSSSKLSSSSSSSSSKSSSPSLSTKSNFKTSSSSSSSSSSSLSKSSGSSDLTKQRDKMKLSSKSSSGSNSPSLSSSDKSKKSSEDYKSSIQLSSQHVVEGLVKQLDTKFQIPKLSARSSESNPTGSSTVSTTSSSTGTLSSSDSSSSKKPDAKPSYQSSSETKSIDPLPTNKLPDSSSKYPVVLASPLKFEEKMMEPVKSSSRSLTSSPVQCASPTKFSSKSCDATSFDEKLNPSATSDALKSLKMDLPIGGISFSDAEIKKPLPLANAKPTDKPAKAGTTSQEAAEMLLDFSSATQATKPPDPGPGKLIKQPPSQVSLHIVKSPVPSPSPKLVNSPSPACIDDELVDDNLVGIGK